MIKILTLHGYMIIKRENFISITPRMTSKGTIYVSCIDNGTGYEYWEVSYQEYERLVSLYGDN